MNCRICSQRVEAVLDLGNTPPANSLLDSKDTPEESFPLVLEYCNNCKNLQLRDCLDAKSLYRNYFYVTPNSSMLHDHYDYLFKYLTKNKYVDNQSFVLEVGSNIGHFLKFISTKVDKVLGIDPAENIVKMANDKGIDTICDFFGPDSANKIFEHHGPPNLIIARHCFAHNSDPHELMKGVKNVISKKSKLVIENAYALNTVENNEFDQIYHEHMFYYSINSMMKLLELHGMVLIDVLISLVHGGSIIFVAEIENGNNIISKSVENYLSHEKNLLNTDEISRFSKNAFRIKNSLKNLLHEIKSKNKTVYTYGATAKGNTLLNFLDLNDDIISFCVDSTKIKQGKFLPKTKIKIISEEDAFHNPPDYYLLTAWNYKDEIITKVRDSGNYHSKFIVPFPNVHVV